MFVDNLLNLLDEKEMTSAELCRRINIPKSSINNWKRGSSPSIDTVKNIANELEVSIDYLINGEVTEGQIDKLYSKATSDERKIINMILNKYKNELD